MGMKYPLKWPLKWPLKEGFCCQKKGLMDSEYVKTKG